MNLKSLFERLRLPQKDGKNKALARPISVHKAYGLEFCNIEEGPQYQLDDSLSVGAETGDIVLDDGSLAPRHAIFELKNHIVTIMPLGGETELAGQKLQIGKAYILKNGDVTKLGDIEIRLHVTEEEIPLDTQAEEVSPPSESEETEEESEGEVEIIRATDSDEKLQEHIEKLKKKNRPKAIGGGIQSAANLLPRTVGVLFDICCAITLWQVFSVFEDFQNLLEWAPGVLQDQLLPLLEEQIKRAGFQQEYQHYLRLFLELMEEAESQLMLSHQVSLLLSWRLLTILIFGVSLGSWMGGVRSYGNVIWKRLGGLWREVLAWVLFPFVFPLLPTLFSKRSLAELLSLTHLYSPSKSGIITSWILFSPLMLALVLVSPLFHGLEFPTATVLEEHIGKANKSTAKRVGTETETEPLVRYASRWFGARFDLPQDMWRLYPRFHWNKSQTGYSLIPSLVFQHKGGATVPLVLDNSFDWPQLLIPVLAHNPPLQEAFPSLWAYVQLEKLKGNSQIQPNFSKAQKLGVEVELQELIKITFALSPDNLIDHVTTYGPFIKGIIDFKSRLFALVEASEAGHWMLSRYGKNALLVYQLAGEKPSDKLIPLSFGPGRVFRVNYASSIERNKAQKLLNTDLWGQSVWSDDGSSEVQGAPLVIDAVAALAKMGSLPETDLEKIYGYFFESTASLLASGGEERVREAQLKAIKNLGEIIQRMRASKKLQPAMIPSLENFHLKLMELYGRLQLSDAAFFLPSQEGSIPPDQATPSSVEESGTSP